ncbi:hypothetical protein ILP97_00470 [Amycolatopsis sp. H6(2020)]|nr:hypothetical protein [Amycolatopsis sp. H6(2020)]
MPRSLPSISKKPEAQVLKQLRKISWLDSISQHTLDACLRTLEVATFWSKRKWVNPDYGAFDSLSSLDVPIEDVELIKRKAKLYDPDRTVAAITVGWLAPMLVLIALAGLLPSWGFALLAVLVILDFAFLTFLAIWVNWMAQRLHERAANCCMESLYSLITIRLSCNGGLEASASGKAVMIRTVRRIRKCLKKQAALSVSLAARVAGRNQSDDDFFKVARHALWLLHARAQNHDIKVIDDAILASIQYFKHLNGPTPWLIPEICAAPISNKDLSVSRIGRLTAEIAALKTVLISGIIGSIPAVIAVIVKH